MLCSAASEIVFLLNGNTLASNIAGDTLKKSMFADPEKFDNNFGLIPKAMSFLTGYGIYICTSTDRFVRRMLDIFAKQRKASGHVVIGLFDEKVYKKVQDYYRIGYYANSFRTASTDLNKENCSQ